jgi:hypothetical protein
MVTTIQVDERTLMLLKKLKQEFNTKSYGEAINHMVIHRSKEKSMAGSLAKYYKNESTKEMVKELQAERRKSDRI